MYPGSKCVENGGAHTDSDRRRSGGPSECVVGRNYRGNDHINHRIVSELAACEFQCNVQQCTDKLKALKKKYKEVIDRHSRSGASVESDEEVTRGLSVLPTETPHIGRQSSRQSSTTSRYRCAISKPSQQWVSCFEEEYRRRRTGMRYKHF